MIKVIEASNDQELALKVTEAIVATSKGKSTSVS